MQYPSRPTIAACTLLLASCAWTPEKYAHRQAKLDDAETCRLWKGWGKENKEPYLSMVTAEIERRGLTEELCAQATDIARQKRNDAIGTAVIIGLAALAVAAVAASNRPSYNYATDSTWSWDLMRLNNGGIGWVCRGVQSGQFADQWHCRGRPMIDSTWPGY